MLSICKSSFQFLTCLAELLDGGLDPAVVQELSRLFRSSSKLDKCGEVGATRLQQSRRYFLKNRFSSPFPYNPTYIWSVVDELDLSALQSLGLYKVLGIIFIPPGAHGNMIFVPWLLVAAPDTSVKNGSGP